MSYWQSTRHPAPCLLFLAPLLIVYEIGVVSLGGTKALDLRNGADAWLREGLAACGGRQAILAPALVVVILGVWLWRRRAATPEDLPGLCLGMTIESVVGALLLWGLSRGFAPLLEALGLPLAAPTPANAPPPLNTAALGQVVTYVGAGVYEEVLFRLVLYGGLRNVLLAAHVPRRTGIALAAAAAALVFAAAHHVGPHGEPVNGFNFVFRVLAGLYFTLVFQLRGCGVAVGAHACYDVLAGIAM
jgi:membrane protease YdiL (CAAX protease family)